jgi:hypothetical protein
MSVLGTGQKISPAQQLRQLSGGTTDEPDAFEHLATITAGGWRFYVSGMSARSRGVSSQDLGGLTTELVMPDVLIRLATQADRVLCYRVLARSLLPLQPR